MKNKKIVKLKKLIKTTTLVILACNSLIKKEKRNSYIKSGSKNGSKNKINFKNNRFKK